MSDGQQQANNLTSTVNSFKSNIEAKVQSVEGTTAKIQSTTDDIEARVTRFKDEVVKSEQVSIASENIMKINQLIEDKFKDHESIRRTVMGVINDFDLDLVRNKTIKERSEELWITSSNYWLAYALIALSAWVLDNPELAKNALAEGERKDAIKTTLFFCLVNLRFGRNEAAKEWFVEYFKTLDPSMLQQETAVLLEAFLNGIFGVDKKMEDDISKLLDDWIGVLSSTQEKVDELVSEYEKFIDNINVQAVFDFKAIEQSCKNSQQVRDSFILVSKYDIILEFVDSLKEVNETNDTGSYKKQIDNILSRLINEFDREELDLKDAKSYYELIKKNNGDIQQADKQYEAKKALEDENSFNFGKQMIKWALYDTNEAVGENVRKFSIKNTKNWFKHAIESFSEKVNSSAPKEFELKIGRWKRNSDGHDRDACTKEITTFFEKNKFQNVCINKANGIAAILLILSAGLTFISIYSLIVTAASLIFIGVNTFRALKKYPQTVEKLMGEFNACMDDIARFQKYFEDKHQLKEKIINTIDNL